MVKTEIKTTKWDILDYLDTEEAIAAFLEAALEENDTEFFLKSLGEVAKARGINDMAKQMNVSRESLYKSLSGKRNPSIKTIFKALSALGLKISIVPQRA